MYREKCKAIQTNFTGLIPKRARPRNDQQNILNTRR